MRETNDPAMRAFLSKRLEALKRIGFLEYKIKEYKKRFNKTPSKLQDLIDSGVITKIPSDPYGGEFYLLGKRQGIYYLKTGRTKSQGKIALICLTKFSPCPPATVFFHSSHGPSYGVDDCPGASFCSACCNCSIAILKLLAARAKFGSILKAV